MPESTANKIRKLREEKGLTQQELAEKIGISKTLLSQIEEGKIIPSVATLIQISRLFGLSLKYFTGIAEKKRITVVRSYERKEVERRPKKGPSRAGYHYESLASKEGIDAFFITFEEKKEDERVYFQHQGKEFLYVIEGQLELCLEDECIILEPGDSASYESKFPHSLRGVRGPAKAVVVIYGE